MVNTAPPGRSFLFGHRVMRAMISPVESSSPVLAEGPEPDVLYGLVAPDVPVVASAALGGADAGPSRGLVESAGEARGFDESLDEDGGGVVALGPVFRQLAADEREDVRAEVGVGDPGEDEEPGVADHQREVFLAQLRRPSDEAVVGRELACGGGEAEHGEEAALAVVDSVAHLGADQGLVAEVVVAGDELVPAPALAGVVDDGMKAEGPDLVEGRGRREQRWFGVGSEEVMGRRGGRRTWAAAGRSARRCAWPAWSPWPSCP